MPRKLQTLFVSALTLITIASEARIQIAKDGNARCVIVTQLGATAAERHAASELASALEQITGAKFQPQELTANVPESAIVIGPGALAAKLFPEVQLSVFGGEEYIVRTKGKHLLLAGGRPRGTLYAVYRFLQDELGVRWFAPWASHFPKHPILSIGKLDRRGKPAFEYRDPFWFPAFDGDWAARNFSVSQTARLKEHHGGQTVYKGFVHTFYPLVPADPHFKTHPEWFSLLKGKRVAEGAQLCTTDPVLRDFMVERVKTWLRESPNANIVSVSQNDHFNPCECEHCAAVDEREGSHAGSLLELVNYVAEKIELEFPNVLVDTLAYQYTRKAPKTIRPRRNVIIRLCSIECNFAKPLEDPSNELFARDIRDWQRLTDRLYIWDYTTDFAHYVMPFPNYFVLGPNARFFHRNGVVGLFEQGAYQSFGGEMSELRAWVLARLLWNPYQDDRQLIREFVAGYYGKASAPFILRHLQLISEAAQPYYIGIFHPDANPYLRFPMLAKAEQLWARAEVAAQGNPEHLWRVRQSRLSVGYIWLAQWTSLQRECRALGKPWPINSSRKAYASQWLATVNEAGPAGWSPITHLRESGFTPAEFVAQLGNDPDEAAYETPTRRAGKIAAPGDLDVAAHKGGLSVQDDRAIVFREPDCSRFVADPLASDGVAIRMNAGPGSARGAMEIHTASLPRGFRPGRYQVYFVARVETGENPAAGGNAFQCRVFDASAAKNVVDRMVKVSETGPGYRSYLAGTVDVNSYSRLWLGHAHNPAVKAVWLDRLFLVPVN